MSSIHDRLTVDEFLERVTDMPDIEAEQELVLRKERGAMEVAMLNTELHRLNVSRGDKEAEATRAQICLALQVVGADNLRINARLKIVHKRMDRASWSRAVTACFGPEGWEQCRAWMAAQETRDKA